MGGVVKGLDKVVASMDLEKVYRCSHPSIISGHSVLSFIQISSTMAKFEGLFEDLDTHTQVMDSAMSTATTLSTPQDQVEALMSRVKLYRDSRAFKCYGQSI